MVNKTKSLSTLLASVSGILVFISLAHFIDLNGFTKYSPIIILIGVVILFVPSIFVEFFKSTKVITKPILLTVSHILIFIGLKTYLSQYIETYWIGFFIIGIYLLNHHDLVAEKIFKGR